MIILLPFIENKDNLISIFSIKKKLKKKLKLGVFINKKLLKKS